MTYLTRNERKEEKNIILIQFMEWKTKMNGKSNNNYNKNLFVRIKHRLSLYLGMIQ